MIENEYKISLEDFDGPLDLLLNLVQDKKIDILEINLADLASQYLEIISNLKEEELDIAGEYLFMATTLLQIKAKMLLSDPEELQKVEEDKQAILMRLAEYKQFKEISLKLREQEQKRQEIFIKKASDFDDYYVEKDNEILDGHSSALKFITTMRKLFERKLSIQHLKIKRVDQLKITTKDQELFIKKLLKNKNFISSAELIEHINNINIYMITILALLDLVRKQEIIIAQNQEFGDLIISKGNSYEG